MQEMNLIQVLPNTCLAFTGPFDQPSYTSITIKNRSTLNVLYKVKTTAPNCYFMRPYATIVKPNSSATVSVILEPNLNEPVTDKTQHQFTIQAVCVGNSAPKDIDQFWSHIQPDQIQELKLGVMFVGLTSFGSTDLIKQLSEKTNAISLGGGSGSSSLSLKSNAPPVAFSPSPLAQKDQNPLHRQMAKSSSAMQSTLPMARLSSQPHPQSQQPQSYFSMLVLLLLLL